MKKSRGSVILLTILVVAGVFFFAVSFMSMFLSRKNLARQFTETVTAEQAAAAGIERALPRLSLNHGWTEGFAETALTHSGATYAMSFTSQTTGAPYCTNNWNGTEAVTGYNGRSVPGGRIHLISVGRYSSSTRIEEAILGPSVNFSYAVTADEGMTISGTVLVDSYNSDVGPYPTSRQETGGDIATNASEQGVVTLGGTLDIQGEVTVGPGGSASSIKVNGGGVSYDGLDVASTKVALPVLAPPAGGTDYGSVKENAGNTQLAPGRYASLTGGGNATFTLDQGDYVMSGDLKLTADARIVIPASAKVRMFVGGNIGITGQSITNESGVPLNFLLFGGESTTTFRISGGGTITAGIYTPEAAMSITGNTTIFGSIICNSMSYNGTGAIHYDQAMRIYWPPAGGGSVVVLSRW